MGDNTVRNLREYILSLQVDSTLRFESPSVQINQYGARRYTVHVKPRSLDEPWIDVTPIDSRPFGPTEVPASPVVRLLLRQHLDDICINASDLASTPAQTD